MSNNIETHADQLRIAADKADAGKFLDRVDAQAVRAAAEKVGRYQSQHAAMLDALRECLAVLGDDKGIYDDDPDWWGRRSDAIDKAKNAMPRGTP